MKFKNVAEVREFLTEYGKQDVSQSLTEIALYLAARVLDVRLQALEESISKRDDPSTVGDASSQAERLVSNETPIETLAEFAKGDPEFEKAVEAAMEIDRARTAYRVALGNVRELTTADRHHVVSFEAARRRCEEILRNRGRKPT